MGRALSSPWSLASGTNAPGWSGKEAARENCVTRAQHNNNYYRKETKRKKRTGSIRYFAVPLRFVLAASIRATVLRSLRAFKSARLSLCLSLFVPSTRLYRSHRDNRDFSYSQLSRRYTVDLERAAPPVFASRRAGVIRCAPTDRSARDIAVT